MKLAFCLFKYFPYGGLQRDFLRIAKECVRRGHHVDVYTMHWEGELDSALAIHILTPRGWQNHTRAQHFAAEVQKHLPHYDLSIGFNKMPGLDIYYAADTCYQANARKKHNWLYRLSPRYQHLVAFEKSVFGPDVKTKILLISSAQQPDFIRFYGTESTRFYLLPPGIAKDRIANDTAMTQRNQTRDALKISQNQFLLLMVGSGFKTKGLDRILLGLAALPQALKEHTRLLIIGKDNPTKFIQLAKKLNLLPYIQFLGGRDDIPQLLLAGDLLVHPAYNENTGTVLLEALAAGLPVLTTDVCGYAHYITEANAGIVLSSPYQQPQFNQALLEMLKSPLQSTWRTNGIAFAKQADIYSMPERAVDIIEAC